MKKFELDESTFDKVGEYFDKRMSDDNGVSWLTLFEEGLQKLRENGIDEELITFLYFTAGHYSTECMKDGLAKGLYEIEDFDMTYDEFRKYIEETYNEHCTELIHEQHKTNFKLMQGEKLK